MLPKPLVNDESGKILTMKVLACTYIRVEQHRVVLDAKSFTSPNQKALSTVVYAVSAAKEPIHGYAFPKYF